MDSLTAFAMFARHSNQPNCAFVPLEKRQQIYTGLSQGVDLRPLEVPPPDTDLQAVARLAELLESNKVLQMVPLVPSPVV